MDGRVAEGALLSRLAMEGMEIGQNFFVDEFPHRLQAYLSAATVDFGDVGLLVKRLNEEPEQVLQECRQSSAGVEIDTAIRATIIAQSLYRLGHAEEAKQQIVKEIQVSNVDLTVYVILLLEYIPFRCSKRSHLKKNVELSMTLKEKELEQLPPLLRVHAYQALGWSLGYLGRHAEALEVFRSAVDLARQVGDRREEVVSLRLTASPLSKLGLYSEALQTYALVFGLARKITNLSQFLYAFIDCLLLAQRVPMPGISGLFAEAVLIARANPSLAVVAMHLDLHEVLIAALQAGELDAFDAVIAEHGDWLVNQRPPYVFREDGEHLAAIAAKDGRMAGWQAMASMLPRLAHLQALTPDPNRNRTWLRTLMTLFARACRDPGLLRDVAGLLTPDLSPEAEASAALLLDLARVDEADVPERVLSRMDPDRALVIRRLRGLPDPEPPRRQGAGRKTRR
ncbi:MAG: tetratricopeptide repeat protein [Alphaproteobacteria bacterium]|nr:MAG: tetratricopeptide repeat protein [Alphaproteobacteria bacterium]